MCDDIEPLDNLVEPINDEFETIDDEGDYPIGVNILPENDPTLDTAEMDECGDYNDAFECPIEPEFDDTFQDIVEMDAFPDSDLGNCF